MQTLVETKSLKVQVRDVHGLCVCTNCRGGGEVFWCGDTIGDIWTLGWQIRRCWYALCPQCRGDGYWRADQPNAAQGEK